MKKYNVHAGHCPQGQGAYGAVGIIAESVENRKVKDKLIANLRGNGNTVYDTTCNFGTSIGGCLNYIVGQCNSHSVDLDVSIHLNAGRNDYKGDGKTCGVEVLVYDTKGASYPIALRICEEISKEFGYANRGVKVRPDLCVLRETNAQALLIECCFVDDKDDTDKWDANRCADAIARGMGVNASSDCKPSVPVAPDTSRDIDITYGVMVQGGEIYPFVTNQADYAGLDNKKIVGIAMKSSQGYIEYRAHAIGSGWMPWVKGCNWSDFYNGYAGDGKTPIDAVAAYLHSPNGDKYLYYKASPIGTSKYYPYQIDTQTSNGQDGYAGEFGYPIDKLSMYAE